MKGQEYSKYTHSIYWNAGQLLAIPSSLSVGFEMQLKKNLFLDLEGGWLLYAYNFYEGENREGYKIEPGLKIYFNKHVSLTPKLQFKKANQTETSFVARYNYQYFEQMEYTIERTLVGLICDLGAHGDFGDSRLGWEFNIGLGIGSINVQNDLPEDAEIDDNNFELFGNDGDYGIPLFRYGFKIKYYLKENYKELIEEQH